VRAGAGSSGCRRFGVDLTVIQPNASREQHDLAQGALGFTLGAPAAMFALILVGGA
jgi:hypothetical protein